MSKAVKELVQKELTKRFDGITSMAVVDFTGVDAVSTSQIRKRLVSKGMRVMVVKNALAKQAFKTVGMDAAVPLLDGPCAIATGGDSVIEVVRELLDIGKETPELTVKAAVLEGEAFGPDSIKELSRYPTRDEAIGKLVSCVMWPGALLAGCLLSPGRKVASLVKTIQDQAEGDAPPQDDGQESAEAAAPAKEAEPAPAAEQENVETS
jgi:large subunit ribosomal protein L10